MKNVKLTLLKFVRTTCILGVDYAREIALTEVFYYETPYTEISEAAAWRRL